MFWQIFFPITLKILFHSLLPCHHPYYCFFVYNVPFLQLPIRFLFISGFKHFDYDMPWYSFFFLTFLFGAHWDYIMHEFMIFIKFEKFLVIISLNIFSVFSPSLTWGLPLHLNYVTWNFPTVNWYSVLYYYFCYSVFLSVKFLFLCL